MAAIAVLSRRVDCRRCGGWLNPPPLSETAKRQQVAALPLPAQEPAATSPIAVVRWGFANSLTAGRPLMPSDSGQLRRCGGNHTLGRPQRDRLRQSRWAQQEGGLMRRTTIAAGFAVFATATIAAGPALAGYGALAHDPSTGKFGLSSNEESQRKADDVALKECGSDKCVIVFRMAPRECGAIATAETGTAWGAGKHAQRAAAELAAMQNCQKNTKGQCKLRSADCNH
jgi:hypothetical protein